MNEIDLKGRYAIVTGGAQGLGLAIASKLLLSGASVCVWDRDIDLLKVAAEQLEKLGTGFSQVVDVSDADSVLRATEATAKQFGKIDILVANAGIAGPNHKTWEYPTDAWQQILQINLTGVFFCCRAVLPYMLEKNYGRIINVSSIAGKEGNANASAYSASKAGVIALTKSLGN